MKSDSERTKAQASKTTTEKVQVGFVSIHEYNKVLAKANDLAAEVLMQNQMIDGARKAASKLMIKISELESKLTAQGK